MRIDSILMKNRSQLQTCENSTYEVCNALYLKENGLAMLNIYTQILMSSIPTNLLTNQTK